MAYGTPEYYRDKLALLRESLARDTLGIQAVRIQDDLDKVRNSTRNMEDKLDSMDEEIWRLKRELTRSNMENNAKQLELNRIRKYNKDLLWANFELEMEVETLRNSVRIYKDASVQKKMRVTSAPPWRY